MVRPILMLEGSEHTDIVSVLDVKESPEALDQRQHIIVKDRKRKRTNTPKTAYTMVSPP